MIVCNLTKPEATQEQVRKAYPKLQQTDAAQISIALVLTGKYATAHYDGQDFKYPTDIERFTKALSVELNQIQQEQDTGKKLTKAALAAQEEEPVEIKVGLSCNLEEGEKVLGANESLKTLLGEIVKGGVEFQYAATDILWQWALDRANWSTVSGGDLNRRVKLKANFMDSATGTELGVGGKTKRVAKPKTKEVAEIVEVEEAPSEVELEEAIPE